MMCGRLTVWVAAERSQGPPGRGEAQVEAAARGKDREIPLLQLRGSHVSLNLPSTCMPRLVIMGQVDAIKSSSSSASHRSPTPPRTWLPSSLAHPLAHRQQPTSAGQPLRR